MDPTKLSGNDKFYKPTAYDPTINTYETRNFTMADYLEYKQKEGKEKLKTVDDYIASSIFNQYESICVKKELIELENEIKNLESFIEIEKLNTNLNNLKQQEEELIPLEEINEKIEDLKQHESLSQLLQKLRENCLYFFCL